MLWGFPSPMSPDPSPSISALHTQQRHGTWPWQRGTQLRGEQICRQCHLRQQELQLRAPDSTAQADDLISTIRKMGRTRSTALCNAGVLRNSISVQLHH